MRTFCSGPDQAKSWRSRVAPFLPGGRKVIGVEPTFTDVYEDASGVSAEAIILPLRADYTQDVGALVRAARRKHRDAGFVYLCTPNNPTGIVVTQQEVRELLHGVPDGVPVLIDEAYHHYAAHPQYATSVPYVVGGRNVIVARVSWYRRRDGAVPRRLPRDPVSTR
ncbi:MAG: aminotransferase class I/II-fold pyridoxal phosphate-dependent enzyme [Acidobacteriota bacterium]|nr:aminotransferase class I/II-fold pyridoxal phosphate-dependent enzyme [Acidobacteriota bacterium]